MSSKEAKYCPEDPMDIKNKRFTPTLVIYKRDIPDSDKEVFVIVKGLDEDNKECVAMRKHTSGKPGWPQIHGKPSWFVLPVKMTTSAYGPSDAKEITDLLNAGLCPSVLIQFKEVDKYEVGDIVMHKDKWYYIAYLHNAADNVATITRDNDQERLIVPLQELEGRYTLSELYSTLPSWVNFHEDRILLWLLDGGSPAISFVSPARTSSSKHSCFARHLRIFDYANPEDPDSELIETDLRYFMSPGVQLDGALLLGELTADKEAHQAVELLKQKLKSLPSQEDIRFYDTYSIKSFDLPRKISTRATGHIKDGLASVGEHLEGEARWCYYDLDDKLGLWSFRTVYYIKGAGYEEHQAFFKKVKGYVEEFGDYEGGYGRDSQLVYFLLKNHLAHAWKYLSISDLQEIAEWYEMSYGIDTEEK